MTAVSPGVAGQRYVSSMQRSTFDLLYFFTVVRCFGRFRSFLPLCCRCVEFMIITDNSDRDSRAPDQSTTHNSCYPPATETGSSDTA
eukprot:616126-Rhodomonas_salina.1